MPHVPDEEDQENHSTSSSFILAKWWRKFHFSGRVIACSVLLGLGLILIGGLIFAINITDSDSKPSDSDGATGPVTTKAPSNYTGPVVMGIGGFIVITGVIMCLFETQVCRKRTGDSSPLISEKAGDPESKDSDPAPGPSTTHGHKSRKHGAHKNGVSPKKSKSRHAKSRSKERSQQKSLSPKSPAVPILQSKAFMTSSEDNFLTPPNTLEESDAVVNTEESGNAEVKHSSLMKSFTSSDPSWNQSTEFVTPSASFRDTSVSLNNSVEISANNDEKKLRETELSEKGNISPEYMTPLTVEEDRIQNLLIRVKNEQKQMAESKKETNVGTSEFPINSNFSQAQVEIAEKSNEVGEKTKNEISSSNMPLPEGSSTSKDVNQEPSTKMEDANPEELSENNSETNVTGKKLIDVHNEEISGGVINVTEGENSIQRDSPSLSRESKDTTLLSDKGAYLSSNRGSDLDSSVSSDETVVSPDSFPENAVNSESSNENSTLVTLKENFIDETKSLGNISESSNNKLASEIDVDLYNNQEKVLQKDVAEVQDLSLSEKDDVKIEAFEEKNESKDKAS